MSDKTKRRQLAIKREYRKPLLLSILAFGSAYWAYLSRGLAFYIGAMAFVGLVLLVIWFRSSISELEQAYDGDTETTRRGVDKTADLKIPDQINPNIKAIFVGFLIIMLFMAFMIRGEHFIPLAVAIAISGMLLFDRARAEFSGLIICQTPSFPFFIQKKFDLRKARGFKIGSLSTHWLLHNWSITFYDQDLQPVIMVPLWRYDFHFLKSWAERNLVQISRFD